MKKQNKIMRALLCSVLIAGLLPLTVKAEPLYEGEWGDEDQCQPTCLGSEETEAVNHRWEEVSSVAPETGDEVCVECNDDFRCYIYMENGWDFLYGAGFGEDDFLMGTFDLGDTHSLPCETLTISRHGTLTCGGAYAVSASAQVPCVQVKRWPYPRGMVNLENTFEIAGPYVSQRGVGQSAGWCSPGIRNYTLEVEWRMRSDVLPVWSFDEREWAEEPDYQRGFAVTHTYQTSSWAKPGNGPSLEGTLDLPAYQVELGTAWQPYVRRSWEERVRERVELNCRGCGSGVECEELCAVCGPDGTDREDTSCYEEHWEARTTGWQAVDLLEYGYRNPYYTSWSAGDVSQPPSGIPPVPMRARLCLGIPVPVIEVQVYLNAP